MNKAFNRDLIVLCVSLAALTVAAFDLKSSLDKLAYEKQGPDENPHGDLGPDEN